MQSIIKISGPLDICLQDGQQIAVIGDNAAGKTDLVNILLGRRRLPGNPISYDFSPSHSPMVSDNIRYIAFQDAYGEAGNNYYHQLRWNSVEIDEETPTAGELLDNAFALACASGNDVPAKERLRDSLYDMFGLRPLLDKYIISLSSGELRKFQIARALFSMPRVLILDNPFIGLDAPTRDLLSALLGELGSKNRIMMILVMSRVDVLPSFITHIIPVEGLSPRKMIPASEFKPHMVFPEIASDIMEEILSLPHKEYSS
ncbi:MAG: ATP-binding cassette domain-containing protein, partial [Bacteroidales bacterium]|nr:ATP-binding cassette domain-containing protein [Bacteroidales bacterium]